MPEYSPSLPDFTRWPSFPFEGDMRVKRLADPVEVEPPRSGEDAGDCVACNTPDDAYIWVSERWRVRAMDRPTGLPMVLILECRSHLDLGDLPNLLAAELGVMTVRLERAIRSLDGVARVHVNRWGDGSAHLHMWFLARPYGRLQLRGTFLSLWDDILPVIPEEQWRENLALVAAWLAEFGGRAIAEPPHIHWQSPSTFSNDVTLSVATQDDESGETPAAEEPLAATEENAAVLPTTAPGEGNGNAPGGSSTSEGDEALAARAATVPGYNAPRAEASTVPGDGDGDGHYDGDRGDSGGGGDSGGDTDDGGSDSGGDTDDDGSDTGDGDGQNDGRSRNDGHSHDHGRDGSSLGSGDRAGGLESSSTTGANESDSRAEGEAGPRTFDDGETRDLTAYAKGSNRPTASDTDAGHNAAEFEANGATGDTTPTDPRSPMQHGSGQAADAAAARASDTSPRSA